MPEAADQQEGDAVAQARPDHPLGNEESREDQQHKIFRKAGEGLLRGYRSRQHGDHHSQQGRRKDGQGVEQHCQDGRDEDGEQLPGFRLQPPWDGGEPDEQAGQEGCRAAGPDVFPEAFDQSGLRFCGALKVRILYP